MTMLFRNKCSIVFNTQYPGRITFVCVGPLTNVALAIKMYHDFAGKVKALYLMGGNCNGTLSSFKFYGIT